MAKGGSRPHACSATTSSEVVEVLPWVPATATHRRSSSAAARRRTSCRSPPRGDELLVPGVDGSREDERVGVVEVPRGVADDDVGAERSQPGHGDRLPGLAAADRQPAVEQDAGERAHPGAGDAHDVHPAETGTLNTTC
jgi:hypothetical protein